MAYNRTLEDQIRECVDRCRRMETRLIRFLDSQGFDTQTQRPVLQHRSDCAILEVPTPNVSLKDVIAAIPEDWSLENPIIITHKGEELGELYVSRI